jgi:hypothetical protein
MAKPDCTIHSTAVDSVSQYNQALFVHPSSQPRRRGEKNGFPVPMVNNDTDVKSSAQKEKTDIFIIL